MITDVCMVVSNARGNRHKQTRSRLSAQ